MDSSYSHVPRITQVDSKSLDDEVYLILKSTLANAFQYGGQNFLVKFQAELDAALQLLLGHFTLGKNSQSIGQQLLQITYNEGQNSSKLKYYIYSIIFSLWLKQRLFLFTSFIKKENLRSSTIKMVDAIETIYQSADLLNLMYFLIGGKYPTILERVFNLNVIPVDKDKVRTISYAYFTRELLWNGFADLLSTTLPLIPAKKFHNLLIQFLPSSFSTEKSSREESSEMVEYDKPETICTICNELAILPQRFGCRHITCYYCIYSTIQVGTFRCPICGIKVDNSSEVNRM